ncbi:tetratricopeptide repeat protein [candidate division KSB1 bacterium]|nr:tetratricopeptide repeat protein [candidate division KSB1 bacterium]
MKRTLSVGLAIVLSVGIFFLMSCQTKEVTSAKVYIQQDDWDKAIEQLEQAVQLYPNDMEAHYLLAQGYGKQGKFPEMVREMDASLAIGPQYKADIDKLRQYHWGTNFNKGIKSHKEEDQESAVESFKTAILIDPTRPEAYKNLAIVYSNMQMKDKSAEVYEDLVKVVPNDAQALRQLAQLRRDLKEYKAAVDVLKKALALDPNDSGTLSSLAITYDLMGEKQEAFSMYENALANDPGNTDLMFNLGQLHFQNGNYDEAINLFDKVINASPDDYDSNLRIGYAYLGIADEVTKEINALIEKSEDVPQEMRDKRKGFFEKAVPYLEKCTSLLEQNPSLSADPSKVWHFLAVAYINTGEKEKGEAAFKKEEQLK